MAGHDEGVTSGLSYSVLEDDTESPHPQSSYRPSAVFNSGPAANRNTIKGCFRASAPHLLILVVYLVYLLVGGGIFLALESAQQIPTEMNFTVELARHEAMMVKLELAMQTESEENLTKILEDYYFSTKVDKHYFGNDYYLEGHELSYTKSVLFCLTTIATIGYGDYVPHTSGGRVATAFYALVGIPLTVIFLIDMGTLLARLVAFLLSKCQCRRGSGFRPSGIYKGTSEPVTSGNPTDPRTGDGDSPGNNWQGTAGSLPDVPVVVVLAIWLVYLLLASLVIASVEGWPYGDGLFFTLISITTIGYGDVYAIQHHTHIPSFFVLLVNVLLGLSVTSMCIILLLPKVVMLVSNISRKISL